jgi:hypothetical protein
MAIFAASAATPAGFGADCAVFNVMASESYKAFGVALLPKISSHPTFAGPLENL